MKLKLFKSATVMQINVVSSIQGSEVKVILFSYVVDRKIFIIRTLQLMYPCLIPKLLFFD